MSLPPRLPPRAMVQEVGHPTRQTRPTSQTRPTGAAPQGSPRPAAGTTQPSAGALQRWLRALLREERSSFGYAIQGLGHVWRTQRHLRIHAGIALLAVGLGLLLGLTPAEWAVLVTMITLVLALEMLNTVLEVVVDLVSPTYHPLAKIAKDVAAGAVLLAAVGAVGVGLLLFGPRLAALWPAPVPGS